MKTFLSLMAICLTIALVSLPLAYGQQEKGGAPGGAPQAEKTFQGQLAKVDASAKTISVKGTGDMDMVFAYTEQTQVVGPQKDVQGLASQAGAPVRVTYRDAGANHIATKIEVAEKK